MANKKNQVKLIIKYRYELYLVFAEENLFFQSLLNEFNFIQSKLDEIKYEIQTSATSIPAGSASPKVGATTQAADQTLSAEEQKELEKKVLISHIDFLFQAQLIILLFLLAINRSFRYLL